MRWRSTIVPAFGSGEPAMNAFYEHHRDSIRFGYRCFDRILLNGLIQPFQQPERVVGFFATYRHLYPVSRDVLRGADRAVSALGDGECRQMERPDCRGAKGPARRIRRPLLQGSKARSDRRHPESQRTGTYYDGDRRQEAQPLASSDRRPLDRAIQPLYQRPALEEDLRSHVPVPPVLGPGLSQSTSLAGEPNARGRDRLPAVLQRFSQMREARAPPRTGARPNRRGSVELR